MTTRAGREPAAASGLALTPRKSKRRAEILTAAARLFAERGCHGVPADGTGSAVGISGPGLYRHFAGKDAMLAQMLLARSLHGA